MSEKRDNSIEPITGFPSYGVDRAGNIYKSGKDGVWLQKKPYLGKNGYKSTSLWSKNTETRRYIHHLVLETFVGPRPESCEALHGDGDRLNNAVSNLRWGTRKENLADAISHGTFKRGSASNSAKLKRSDVLFLRDMVAMGFSDDECARQFDVSISTIARVRHGQTYVFEV